MTHRLSTQVVSMVGAALLLLLLALAAPGHAALLARVSPAPLSFTEGVDFRPMGYSGLGDVTARLMAVDVSITGVNALLETSGCEAADFAGFVAGAIALLERGTCTFEQKAENAAAAGALAVIIFNSSTFTNDGSNDSLLLGNLTDQYSGGIPVVGTTYAVGRQLFDGLAAAEVVVRVAVSQVPEPAVGWLLLPALAVLARRRARRR